MLKDPVLLNELSLGYSPLLLQIGPDVPNIEEYKTKRTDWDGYQIRVVEFLSEIKIVIQLGGIGESRGLV